MKRVEWGVVDLSVPLMITQGYAAPEVKETFDRALALCREIGETPQLFPVFMGLSRFYTVRSEFRTASGLGEQMVRLAHRAQDPHLLSLAYMRQSGHSFFQGQFALAQAQAEQALTLYDPQQSRGPIFIQKGKTPKGAASLGRPCRCGTWGIPTRRWKKSTRRSVSLGSSPFPST
jgi:predicted ATPase